MMKIFYKVTSGKFKK